MPLAKDDIDAVQITQFVNGDAAFMIYLTRGGLTKRQGSSDRVDPGALLITGGTDAFGPFMEALPEHLLERGAAMEDGGSDGARHEWRFELAGGMNSLIYDIAYHSGSASLPDEFADMVVVAERLTHSWYNAAVAEETGVPIPSVGKAVAPPPPRASSSGPKKAAGKRPGGVAGAVGKSGAAKARPQGVASRAPGQLVLATRERIALAVLLDLFVWTIPYSFLAWLFVGGSQRSGPPGAGLVLFAIAEFLVLQMARRSPGYWLLGISAPVGERPQVDTTWHTRESQISQATGGGLCGLGVAGLTSWTLYHTPVPYFGLDFPLWLSIPIALLGSVAMVLAGALVLRTDLRGVWLGGSLALLLLLLGATGWGAWGGFVDTALADRSAYEGRPVGEGLFALVRDLVPVLLVVGPALLLFGVFRSWQRLTGPAERVGAKTAKRS